MNIPALALALVLLTDVSVMILRSGHRIAVEGPVRINGANVVFRHPSGVLYSLPLNEIDIAATETANNTITPVEQPLTATEQPKETRRLAVSQEEKERLLRQLEKSRGTPVPPRKLPVRESVVADEIDVRESDDEEYWRAEAKRLEENVRHGRDQIDVLRNRVRRLEDEIRTFVAMGTSPDQFGGNVMQLEDARASLENAELQLARAERELADFHDRARRQGILPGWLR